MTDQSNPANQSNPFLLNILIIWSLLLPIFCGLFGFPNNFKFPQKPTNLEWYGILLNISILWEFVYWGLNGFSVTLNLWCVQNLWNGRVFLTLVKISFNKVASHLFSDFMSLVTCKAPPWFVVKMFQIWPVLIAENH